MQVDHVKAERNVLAEVRHHSIVRLFYSFQVGLPLGHPLRWCFWARPLVALL